MERDSTGGGVDPATVLKAYRLPGSGLYTVGTFDRGITVLSQQVRALNLVWAFVEAGEVGTTRDAPPARIAIVGGGFAGLTVAAGLVAKGANAHVTIFEQRDTVLPLQQGSDARWLHPHIYDWPSPGSESASAGLPLLNWTANRASDVVVEVIKGWGAIMKSARVNDTLPAIEVFCNTRHLQVRREGKTPPMQLEWVGEAREADTLTVKDQGAAPAGLSGEFDLVVMAVGFGIEAGESPGAEHSYWRNETFAQPHLDGTVARYIISGAGDGGLIDLCRLRIAQFRQDRILYELFRGRRLLVDRLREIERDYCSGSSNLFDDLSTAWDNSAAPWRDEADAVVEQLRGRLRRDTEVILHLRFRSFADLFTHSRRTSFQNKVLAFLLFRAGAFYPSTGDLAELAGALHIAARRVVVRHGTRTPEVLESILDGDLWGAVRALDPEEYLQSDVPGWGGGYFGYTGSSNARQELGDSVRAAWRKEYLPAPTQALAMGLCAAIAGRLSAGHPMDRRLRVTLHRTLLLGRERLLQQCCEYTGINLNDRSAVGAGRTFQPTDATIGLANQSRQIVRTRRGAQRNDLVADMATLELTNSSRKMIPTVMSVLAIPLLHSSEGRSDVVGVLYVDSEMQDAFADDWLVDELARMTGYFMDEIGDLTGGKLMRLVNNSFWSEALPSPPLVPSGLALRALELLDENLSPISTSLSRLNVDLSEFEAVE